MNIIGGRTFSVDKENCLLHLREGYTTLNLSLTIDGSISFPFHTHYHILFLVDGTCQRCGRVSEASIPRIEKETHGIH